MLLRIKVAPCAVVFYTEGRESESMNAALLILGVLTMKPQEPALSLEAKASERDGDIVVVASLLNRGKERVVVILDDYFCRIDARLYDGQGRELRARDSRAAQGARLPPREVKPVVIAPGKSEEVQTFTLVMGYANGMAGDLSWELQNHYGQKLQVDFTYTFSPERLADVEKLGARGVAVGTWTSPKVDVPTKKLTQKQVDNILSSRKLISDPDAVPLMIKSLGRKEEVVREYGATSLGDLKSPDAGPALAQLLLRDPDRVVRVCAARALGAIADPALRSSLEQAAREDDDSLVRTLAGEALGKLPR